MGASQSWLVIESAKLDGASLALGVRRTGRRSPQPEFPLSARALADGSVLVVSRHCDEPLFAGKKLVEISRRHRVVLTVQEEHVMESRCTVWSLGRKKWSVVHKGGDEGSLHLKTMGKLPAEFAEIRNRAFELQRNQEGAGDEPVDFVFDVPLRLARALTGVDHEQGFADATVPFEELDIGRWRRWWRSTSGWRIGFGLLGGLIVLGFFLAAITDVVGRVLRWLLAMLGIH
jgi:hypothetical protein